MTNTTPVERVAAVLIAANYRRLPPPLQIAGLKFAMPASFVGTGTSSDLIVVADTIDTDSSPERLQKSIEGIARALDVMKSKRPLTTIVVGPRPTSTTLECLARVGRVLPVLDAGSEAQLRDRLAVLLPLEIAEPKEDFIDPTDVLTKDSSAIDPVDAALLLASREGTSSVRLRLHSLIAEALHGAEDVSGEDVI